MLDQGKGGNLRKFLRREGFLMSELSKIVWKVLVTNKCPAFGSIYT